MPPRCRTLSDLDHAAWHRFARDIARLPGTAPLLARATPLPAAAATPPVGGPVPPARPAKTQVAELVTGLPPAGLDRGSWQRFQGGRMAPTRTLDLHGKTVQAAFLALERFLHAASADHLRCVEIITGRGSGEGGGVIRREMPFWLNLASLRPLILAAAHPHAANPGATRLLLRRKRLPPSRM